MTTETEYQNGEGKRECRIDPTASATPWKHAVVPGDSGGMMLSKEEIKIQDTGISHYSTALENSSTLMGRKLVVRTLSSLRPFLWGVAVVFWEECGYVFIRSASWLSKPLQLETGHGGSLPSTEIRKYNKLVLFFPPLEVVYQQIMATKSFFKRITK